MLLFHSVMGITVLDFEIIFQTMHSVRSNSLSLKYQRITLLGWKDIEV